jgi:hypothetical protein
VSRWVWELGSVTADTAEKARDSHERSLNDSIAQAVGLLTTNEAIQEELLKDNHIFLSTGTHSKGVLTKEGTGLSGVPGAAVAELSVSADNFAVQNLKINSLIFDKDVVGGRIFDCELDKITFAPGITVSDVIFDNCVIKELEFNLGTATAPPVNFTTIRRTIFKACQFPAEMPATPVLPVAITLPYDAQVMFDTCIFSRPLWIGRTCRVNITSCFFNFNIEFVVNVGLVPGGKLQIAQSRFGAVGNLATAGAFVNHPAAGAVLDVQAAGNYRTAAAAFVNCTIQWEIIS